MTTTTVPTGSAPADPRPAAQRLRLAAGDALVITKRNLMVWSRVPAFLFFTLIQPVMFVLLFRYVFGGAIPVHVKGGYVNYLIPGVIGQSAAFASFGTAISLAQELKKGSIDRFRSMPMARSAVLAGRLIADSLRLTVTLVVLLGVGYAVGFRYQNGVGPAVGMILLGVALGVVICCVSAWIGLAIKDEESVQSFGLIWLFPLGFVSTVFVQVHTMPGWLQAFATNQPLSIVVEEMRAMALGGPLAEHGWQSAVWLVGIVAVIGPLAVRSYRRA